MRNNRTAGHKWERLCAQLLKDLFPDVATSRLASREADNQGVDLVRTGPLSFQCKSVKGKVDYHKVLADVQFGVPVILHKMLKRGESKKSTGELLVPEGTYAIMYMDDFINLLTTLLNEHNKDTFGAILPRHPYKRKDKNVRRSTRNKSVTAKGRTGRTSIINPGSEG